MFQLHKARSVSSAPRLVPFEKKTEVEAEAAVVVEPSQVDDAAPDEAAHAPSPTDAWFALSNEKQIFLFLVFSQVAD